MHHILFHCSIQYLAHLLLQQQCYLYDVYYSEVLPLYFQEAHTTRVKSLVKPNRDDSAFFFYLAEIQVELLLCYFLIVPTILTD